MQAGSRHRFSHAISCGKAEENTRKMFLRACGTQDVTFFQNCSVSNASSDHRVLGISLSWPRGGSCSEGGIGC